MFCYTKTIKLLITFVCCFLFNLYQARAQKLVHTGFKNLSLVISTDDYHFFKADDAQGVSQIWRTDGTPDGALQLTHLDADGAFPFFNKGIVKMNNIVFFNLYTPSEGEELWRTDGTPEGTFMIDIRPGAASAFWADDRNYNIVTDLYVMDGYIVFIANDGIHGAEPWRSDGTLAGTYLLADTEVGLTSTGISFYGSMVRAGNLCYFTVADHNVGAYAFLYRTDGTTGGTFKVAHGLNSGLTEAFGKVYFFHRDQIWTQYEQWISDGTINGTHFLYTVQNNQEELIPAKSDLMFYFGKTSQTASGAKALFKTDASGNNTELLFDNLTIGYDKAKVINGKLFFVMDKAWSESLSLGISDGTVAGSVIYKTHTTSGGNEVSFVSQVGNKIVYSWANPQFKQETWITDGTPEGTQTLKNLALGMPENSNFHAAGGIYWKDKHLIITHAYGGGQTYLYDYCVTDGTTAGTVRMTHFKEKLGVRYNKMYGMPFKKSLILVVGYIDSEVHELYVYDEPALLAPEISTTLCKGSDYAVGNKLKGEFTEDNVFSVQLSDASGSFASPTLIGSWASKEGGDISVTIPSDAANGSGYRVRIVSTNPALVSVGNGSNIAINTPAAPGISTTSPYYLCAPQSKTLTASACTGIINWYTSGTVSIGTGNSLVVSPVISSTYYATCTQNTCVSAWSAGITINVATGMYTLKSGNWNDAEVWSCGVVPSASSDAVIKSGHKIMVTDAMGKLQCKLLTIEAGAVFQNEGRYFLAKP